MNVINSNITANGDSSSDSSSDDEDRHCITVDYQEFRDMVKPYVDRIINLAIQTLRIGKISEDTIDKVILVGGSSRLRPVQEALRQRYGNKVMVSNNPEECVSRGALRASKIEEERTGVFLKLVITEYYGFPVYDYSTHREKFLVMIPRNTEYPNDREFSTNCYLVRKTDGTYITWANVDLYQSSDGTLKHKKLLKRFGFKKATPSSQAIKVIYTIDRNGFITVEIKQTCDGRTLRRKEKVVKLKTKMRYDDDSDRDSDRDSDSDSDRDTDENEDSYGDDVMDSELSEEDYEEEVPEPDFLPPPPEPDFLPLPQRREVLPPSPPERHALPSPPVNLERFPFQLPEVPRDDIEFTSTTSDTADIVISEDSDL